MKLHIIVKIISCISLHEFKQFPFLCMEYPLYIRQHLAAHLSSGGLLTVSEQQGMEKGHI